MAYLRSGRSSVLRRGVLFLPGARASGAASRFVLSSAPLVAGNILSMPPNRPDLQNGTEPQEIPVRNSVPISAQ